MKDELKEILIRTKEQQAIDVFKEYIKTKGNLEIDYSLETYMQIILDYITNLQKTQETLIKNDSEIITNLQEQLHQASLDIQELTERDIWCPSNCDKLINLQKENDYLKMNSPEQNIEHFRIIKENKRKIDLLGKQNKELQEENEKLHKELDYADNYNIYLISKKDKAIEYVNNTIFWGVYEDIPMIDTKYGEDLSNILQGEDNE